MSEISDKEKHINWVALKNYIPLVRKMESLEDEIQRALDTATSINPKYSDMPKSSSSDKIQSAVEQIVLVQEMLLEEYKRIAAMRIEAESAVNSIEDIKLQVIVRNKYINGYTLEQIAENNNCCTRTVRRKLESFENKTSDCP